MACLVSQLNLKLGNATYGGCLTLMQEESMVRWLGFISRLD